MRIRNDVDKIRSFLITSPGESDHYGEMMKTFFRVEKLKYPAADYAGVTLRQWQPRRRAILDKLARAIGPFPKEVPLRAKASARHDRGDYTVEGVSFYTRPNWPVSALLYLPKDVKGPVPGVVVVHGHSFAQKAFPTYQKLAIHLAKNGYAALAVDFVGGGERTPQTHESLYMCMAGQTVQGLMIWDNMRAVDYLLTRREVDGARIGITGSSGGGNQTAFTTVFDERLKASAPCNAPCMFEEHMTVGIDNFCPCEVIPGIWTFAEYSDLIATVAPRPLVLLQSVKDRLFPIKGVREVYLRAREVYKAFGAADSIQIWEDYSPHSYAEALRIGMIRFFDKHLKGVEPRPYDAYTDFITVEDEASEVLHAFPDGRLPEGTKTLVSLYGEISEKLPDIKRPRNAAAYSGYRRKVLAHLERMMSRPELLPGLDVEEYPAVEASWAKIRPFSFAAERGIVIPSVLIEPRRGGASRVVVYADAAGKAKAVERRAVRMLVEKGVAVVSVDLRGTGETSGVVPGEANDFTLNRSIMLARHISMMRAFDLSRTIDALAEVDGAAGLPVSLWAVGDASMYGLFAFALDERIGRFAAQDLLLTLRSRDGFRQSEFILPPGILVGADVADIVASSLRRGILIARGQMPTGERPDAAGAGRVLKAAVDAADAAGLEPPRIVAGGMEETEAAVRAFLTE